MCEKTLKNIILARLNHYYPKVNSMSMKKASQMKQMVLK